MSSYTEWLYYILVEAAAGRFLLGEPGLGPDASMHYYPAFGANPFINIAVGVGRKMNSPGPLPGH
jgi:hypothetical protein